MVYITEARRTISGAFMGEAFSKQQAHEIAGFLFRNMTQTQRADEVILGNVLQAGQGQSPARQAANHAGLCVPTTTVNKVCGSGMKAIMMACDVIRSNPEKKILAGGMESMTNAPYLLKRGLKAGHAPLRDSLYHDGLEDAWSRAETGKEKMMGLLAQDMADDLCFTRDTQEEYTIQTYKNAIKAVENDWFAEEIVAMENMREDETLKRVNIEKFTKLRPAFRANGTITAATSSSLSDGASAVFLESTPTKNTLACIQGYTSYATAAKDFALAPIGAIKKLCQKLRWSEEDVDLFEINEAFAVVPMAAIKKLNLPREKVNIHGGACCLGHPLGASGARIVVTLAHALKTHSLKRGIAAICIGGGEATAIALERYS